MARLIRLALIALLLCVTLSVVRSTVRAAPPNILFIVADDLGWNDVGWHGAPIRTPNLNRLVREGVELDQHYVHAVCTPTRAARNADRVRPLRERVDSDSACESE